MSEEDPSCILFLSEYARTQRNRNAVIIFDHAHYQHLKNAHLQSFPAKKPSNVY